ncbi:anthranilate phosphoribosyltransferase [Gracilibacillus oryzae]|uniref:Anthranilate phosphoribosyltransferase n=1 Tax=Gracilibacillus oryzae TaxID=1672701 RepID=A0A7C8GV96_9BACI|nr:anthranilate phosphoribosyltransferase [Gracilibacillus oryzae]KAB8138900.1 anthranilate phosphoribosyltransferase [Gracilibacillus oryzae]
MQQWIKEVARGQKGAKDLSYEDTLAVADSIFSKSATDAQIAAYLVGERIKTESAGELLAFIRKLQEYSSHVFINEEKRSKMIDFAGPYNGRNSFAATIPVSIMLAEHGIPVYLAASDTLPPKYGTSIKETMRELGYSEEKSNQIFYIDPEDYCEPLKQLRKIREEIGIRTLFNTAEKLMNLGGAKSIMLGAFHRTAINKLNDVFHHLNYDHVYIVQGLEGSEDVPVHRNSFVFHWTKEDLKSFTVKPADYGLQCKDFDKNQKLSAVEQAKITRSILSGEQLEHYTYYYNQVVMNAGLRYYLFGVAESVEDGIMLAKKQLESGTMIDSVDKWYNKVEQS